MKLRNFPKLLHFATCHFLLMNETREPYFLLYFWTKVSSPNAVRMKEYATQRLSSPFLSRPHFVISTSLVIAGQTLRPDNNITCENFWSLKGSTNLASIYKVRGNLIYANSWNPFTVEMSRIIVPMYSKCLDAYWLALKVNNAEKKRKIITPPSSLNSEQNFLQLRTLDCCCK